MIELLIGIIIGFIVGCAFLSWYATQRFISNSIKNNKDDD